MSNDYFDELDDNELPRPDRPTPGERIIKILELKSFKNDDGNPVLVLESEVVKTIQATESLVVTNSVGQAIQVPASATEGTISGHSMVRHPAKKYHAYFNRDVAGIVNAIKGSLPEKALEALGITEESKVGDCLRKFVGDAFAGMYLVQKATAKTKKLAQGTDMEVYCNVTYRSVPPEQQPGA